ncbi:hypothetical protein AN944_02779 [Shewanella sp. P1-14-1]|uniref:DUF4124 domain-containing protein n=1 Tax=Shewanella sp. P1-14-1 TaxID=1723761 RepID=UPI0006D65507|nr:DUF4124 domain-containing protein [Shewanella sp. P1-14-1]KPZ69797.1 hypothetical protein AN944_02779 [Shewanella sp. P1-14-1]
MLSLRLLYLVSFVCFSQSALATVIYTWVDKDGVSHYSQQPPADVDSKKVYSEDIEPAQVGYVPVKSVGSSSQSSTSEMDLDQKAALIKERDAEQAASICESAKHSLNVLNTYQHLHRKDADTGEEIVITEEERLAQIEKNEERKQLFCQ